MDAAKIATDEDQKGNYDKALQHYFSAVESFLLAVKCYPSQKVECLFNISVRREK